MQKACGITFTVLSILAVTVGCNSPTTVSSEAEREATSAEAKDKDTFEPELLTAPSKLTLLRITTPTGYLTPEDLNFIEWQKEEVDKVDLWSSTAREVLNSAGTEAHALRMTLKFDNSSSAQINMRVFEGANILDSQQTTTEELVYEDEIFDLSSTDSIKIDLYTTASNVKLDEGSWIAFGPVND